MSCNRMPNSLLDDNLNKIDERRKILLNITESNGLKSFVQRFYLNLRIQFVCS